MCESHSVVPDSLQPHGLYSPMNSPGQNTGVGSLSFLQLMMCGKCKIHMNFEDLFQKKKKKCTVSHGNMYLLYIEAIIFWIHW